MGVTIESPKHSIDLGYGGFMNLRNKIASMVSDEFYKFYTKMDAPEVMFLTGDKRKEYFDVYNKEIDNYVNDKNEGLINFLYACDCGGTASVKACRQIYKLIKDYDDDICYGYSGRQDCAMFKDFKEIVKDCIDSRRIMRWF